LEPTKSVLASVAVERFFPDKLLRRASVGPANQKVAESAKTNLIQLAVRDKKSPPLSSEQ